MSSKKKPINYIYNKRMLNKIQLISKGHQSNEMEIKNYAEELDSLENELKIKRNQIKNKKQNVVVKRMIINEEIPLHWKNKLSNKNFMLDLLVSKKDFTKYILNNNLDIKNSNDDDFYSSNQIVNDYNSPKINKMQSLNEKEREKNIIESLKEYKILQNKIHLLMNKHNDGLDQVKSVITENFIDRSKEKRNTKVFRTLKSRGVGNSRKVNDYLIPLSFRPSRKFDLLELNKRISSNKQNEKMELLKAKLRLENENEKGNKNENKNKFDNEDRKQLRESRFSVISMMRKENEKLELSNLISKLGMSEEKIKRLGVEREITVNENGKGGKKMKERGEFIKNFMKLNIKNRDKLNETTSKKLDLSNINNNKDEKFKGIYSIKDPIIKEKIYLLSDYKHYGPYASFCKSCNLKNVRFYNSLEKEKGREILNFLLKNE